jgi:type IV secretion system protein TrbL
VGLRRVKVATAAFLAVAGGELAAPELTAADGPLPCPHVVVLQQGCDAANTAVDNTAAGRAVGAAKDLAGGAIGGAAQDLAGSVINLIAKAIADAAVWFVQQIAGLVDATTQVHLTDVTVCGDKGAGSLGSLGASLHNSPQGHTCYQPVSWFGDRYGAMWGIATVFALILLLVVVLESVGRGDGAMLASAVFLKLPLAFLFTGGAIAATGMLLALSDQMSAAVAGSASGDAHDFFQATASALTASVGATGGTPAVPIFVALLGALVAAVGALFIWLELVMRAASIYIVVFFMPFAFMAMVWPRSAGVLRRTLELLLVLIFAKFVIVAILALGAGALGNASASAPGFSQVMAGGAMLLLAAFSPFVLFRLIPFAEGAVAGYTARRSAPQAAFAGAQSTSSAAAMRHTASANWGRQGTGASAASQAAAGGAGLAASAPAAASGASAAGGAAGPTVAAAKLAAGAGPAAAGRLERTATARAGEHGPSPAPESERGGKIPPPTETPPAPAERPPRPPRERRPPTERNE